MENVKKIKRVININTGELITLENILFTLLENENVIVEMKNGEEFFFNALEIRGVLKRLAFC